MSDDNKGNTTAGAFGTILQGAAIAGMFGALGGATLIGGANLVQALATTGLTTSLGASVGSAAVTGAATGAGISATMATLTGGLTMALAGAKGSSNPQAPHSSPVAQRATDGNNVAVQQAVSPGNLPLPSQRIGVRKQTGRV